MKNNSPSTVRIRWIIGKKRQSGLQRAMHFPRYFPSVCSSVSISFDNYRNAGNRTSWYAVITGHVSRLPIHEEQCAHAWVRGPRVRLHRQRRVQTYRVTMEQRPSVSDSRERTRNRLATASNTRNASRRHGPGFWHNRHRLPLWCQPD